MKISKDKVVDLSYLKDLNFSDLEIDAPGFKNISAINGNKKLKSLAVRGEYKKLYLPLNTEVQSYHLHNYYNILDPFLNNYFYKIN